MRLPTFAQDFQRFCVNIPIIKTPYNNIFYIFRHGNQYGLKKQTVFFLKKKTTQNQDERSQKKNIER